MSRADPSGESVKPSRRDFLRLSASGAALAAHAPSAGAQDFSTQVYPTRPVRIVSGFPPGGISDTYARLIAEWLSEHLGEQFIVENRPGAGSTLAAEYVAKAAPDGYTLLLTTSADAWNETLYDNLNFHVPADFTPVATISRGAGVLVVNPSVPATSVPQLIAYANANRGKVTVASAGVGSAPHMFWELFRSVTGVDMVHVPYRGGGPAVTDLIGGQVMVYFGTFASTIENVRAGRLRALAVTSARRAAVLPDVPRILAGVRGEHLCRDCRAARHACRHRRDAQYGDADGARRRGDEKADRGTRRHAAFAFDIRFCQTRRRRNR
jgi:tripartite-type tricarboxylate transporter receptor subunit TctC